MKQGLIIFSIKEKKPISENHIYELKCRYHGHPLMIEIPVPETLLQDNQFNLTQYIEESCLLSAQYNGVAI